MPELALTPPAAPGPWGWYGKAPGRGDFFRRGLTPGFVAAWDAWMQALIRTGRDALGEGWRAAYFSAPVRRFALSPGLCGPRGAVGVMMPSVDRVGRQFPLCLAAETDASAPAAWQAAAPYFEELETAALSMLHLDAAPERLAEALPAMIPAAPAPSAPLAAALEGLAARPRGSLWVAELADGPHALLADGMPCGAAEAAALFDPGAGRRAPPPPAG
ncbi:type VI secretion system-associated protein TagF [Albimonas pacifica]|uniref:Type VI secretion system protein ImpM n=1 Tax=Albimonas pacifica TaxID=1114924 RepID=A0A1I3CZV2_9RHOB|nr:type VI secretion system-associated protein TagF [Albimonas pacifica]SFH80005.1 type VI secretion system protein ImpM [Albimonas pacifica]